MRGDDARFAEQFDAQIIERGLAFLDFLDAAQQSDLVGDALGSDPTFLIERQFLAQLREQIGNLVERVTHQNKSMAKECNGELA